MLLPPLREMAAERWPEAFGRAELGVWQRSAAAASAGRSAVFVRGLTPQARASLASVGAAVPDAQWRLAYLDAGALATLTLAGDAVQLQLAHGHVPQGHLNLEAVAAPVAIAGYASQAPAAGRGVLVGIIDTGIDLTHKAFFDVHGHTRVVAVWDQDAVLPKGGAHPGVGHYIPSAFGYGHACDERAIDLGTCTFGDFIGHGTHVASIAAGSAPEALGVAAEADIALVRSEHFTQLADAVAFVDHLAQSRGQALVTNISVGGHYGPHDGRTPLETYLNHMTGPGRIIVAAAGNDGQSAVHVALSLHDAPQRVALEHVPHRPGVRADIDFWLPKEAQVHWALELWEAGVPTAQLSLDSPLGTVGHGYVRTMSGDVVADVMFVEDIAVAHDMLHLGLQFIGEHAFAMRAGSRLALRFAGDGDVQGWVGQGHVDDAALLFGTDLEPGFVTGDSYRSIAVPATAARLITVGSYTVQNAWLPQGGGTQSLGRAVIGARSDFSSLGPTGFPALTGLKPDVCAPGSMVVAARSASVPDGPTTLNTSQMVMQGTSMAAPHVTGAIALMLAADNSLQPRDVRRLLRQTARTDDFTQTVPNAAWGFGKLDASAALAATETQAQGCAAVQNREGMWLLLLALCGGASRAALYQWARLCCAPCRRAKTFILPSR